MLSGMTCDFEIIRQSVLREALAYHTMQLISFNASGVLETHGQVLQFLKARDPTFDQTLRPLCEGKYDVHDALSHKRIPY